MNTLESEFKMQRDPRVNMSSDLIAINFLYKHNIVVESPFC